MRRAHVFLIRLSDVELADLESRAKAEGIAKADVIRKAMGWEPEGLIKPGSEKRTRPRPKRPRAPRKPQGTDAGPGERSLAELTRRLQQRNAS